MFSINVGDGANNLYAMIPYEALGPRNAKKYMAENDGSHFPPCIFCV
jgi:hypothetical protein